MSLQNVLVSWEGAVKVSDFGIAKARAATAATASTMIKGKSQYMSPEQANGAPLDGRSDLFAVGIMLWELLTGRRLFEDDTREVLMQVSLGRIPPPGAVMPDVPRDLEAVTMRLLSAEPAARYANAAEANDALARCADAPRSGRAELIRTLAARFPEASSPRNSRQQIPLNQERSTVPGRAAQTTREDGAARPTPVPGWPLSTTLGEAASQAVAKAQPRRAAMYSVLAIAIVGIAAGVTYIATRERGVKTPTQAASTERMVEGTLTIDSTPKNAAIRIDGAKRGRAPIILPVKVGQVVSIEANHDGFVALTKTATIGGERDRIVMELAPVPAAPPSDASIVDNTVPDASSQTATAPIDAGLVKQRGKKTTRVSPQSGSATKPDTRSIRTTSSTKLCVYAHGQLPRAPTAHPPVTAQGCLRLQRSHRNTVRRAPGQLARRKRTRVRLETLLLRCAL